MALTRTWPCSSCVYWEPYPGWKEVGTCDQEMSYWYGRMAVGSGDSCEHFVPSSTPPAARPSPWGPPSGGLTCLECHYWLPFETMPSVGQCDNPDSQHFRSPEFADKPVEGCFAMRSLDRLDFMWCQSHRQTIYSEELPEHKGCLLFVSSVSLPVEDEMELTLAGD